MTKLNPDQAQQVLFDLIAKAKKAGADEADALWVDGASLSVGWREGKLETLDQAEGSDIGLRVLIGKRQAVVSTTDHRPAMFEELVERAVSMARVVPEDPFCGLADPSQISKEFPSIEMADDYAVDAETLIARAKEAEEAALSVKGVTHCDATNAGAGRTHVALASSNGFFGAYTRTNYGISSVALAGGGTEREMDYDYTSTVFQSDLKSPASIGLKAGQKAVANLGARKVPSCQVPVIFDPQEARGLLGIFAGAILGNGIARGTSFLKDFLNKPVFGKGITITDDPFRPRGLRSKLFDAEGLMPSRRKIVDDGVLTTWIMDLRSARQLGFQSTGHAARGTSGGPSPSPTNFYMEAGSLSPAELMKDIKSGLYLTNTMGMGVNGVTGDYSLAARGFWIEDGQISYPVNEITIASNLKEMFAHLTPANDLVFEHGTDSPTLRIESMTIAGS